MDRRLEKARAIEKRARRRNGELAKKLGQCAEYAGAYLDAHSEKKVSYRRGKRK